MTAIAHRPHPVTHAVTTVRGELAGVAATPLWAMNAAQTTQTLVDVSSLKAQVAELEARLLVHADQIEVARDTGTPSTGTWYAAATNTVRALARKQVRIAKALDSHDLTRSALAEGRLHVEQAEVILNALDTLPDDLDPAWTVKAEAHLVDLAADHDAHALRTLGRRLLEVISPEAADAHEAMLLDREERAAAAATRLTIWDDGHGQTHLKGTLPTHIGAGLRKMLYALDSPRHKASKGPLPAERRPSPERLGQAFCELIGRYPVKKLPKTGGLNATVVVLMQLETLLGGLKAAHLDTEETISPYLARKLACEAGIIPAVLDGPSQVLDLGRKRRFHNQAQRILKTIEARGCEVDDCHEPPGRTHLHHPTRWADGGHTNRDAIMICGPHHSRAHDHTYDMTQLPSGKYAFHRRQ